ncbi:hypothetical protein [Sporosarcina koreensis]|uniref:hypothetical protein n=1 Tax=Sporosarcina koreensis TaxID=334735 RepID=UPI0007555484|nr:hypothetical protein [Sporosarcina koreensis]
MYAWLNVGSLVLGLIAWILPIVNLMGLTKHRSAFSIMSLSACAISLVFQIYYNYHLVQIEDWAALMDTMGAVAGAATILLVVTLVLNAITLIVYWGRTVK